MKESIVFLAPNTKEPFTTSKVIAESAQIKHHAVQQLVSSHIKDFRAFGVVAFEMRAVKKDRGTKYEKVYHLNEQQATLLMTYLRNTEIVRKFKMELVRQFYAMRQELLNVRMAKAERRPLRADMTAAISFLPDSPHKSMKYGQFTDLAYMAALGVSARKLRQQRGADKRATASDFMTADEISLVSVQENRIAVLIGIGMDYHQIKAAIIKTDANLYPSP